MQCDLIINYERLMSSVLPLQIEFLWDSKTLWIKVLWVIVSIKWAHILLIPRLFIVRFEYGNTKKELLVSVVSPDVNNVERKIIERGDAAPQNVLRDTGDVGLIGTQCMTKEHFAIRMIIGRNGLESNYFMLNK